MKTLHTILIFCFACTCQIKAQTGTDFITEIQNYDVSKLWTAKKIKPDGNRRPIDRVAPIGFRGQDYQRFYIHFTSVIQNKKQPLQYFVYGKTRQHKVIREFQGTITLKEATVYKDSIFPETEQGSIKGSYLFYESSPEKSEEGYYEGRFQSYFILDGQDNIQYNALMIEADPFKNNQFEGVWKSGDGKAEEKCNWGDFRIPDSKTLDIGTAQFYPDEKFHRYGWKNYHLAWNSYEFTERQKKHGQKKKRNGGKNEPINEEATLRKCGRVITN